MSPKKSVKKKAKKNVRAKKSARAKSKKAAPKKKLVRKAARVGTRTAAARKGSPRKSSRSARTQEKKLGEWQDDSVSDSPEQSSLFDEDIPPDYGGSK